MAVYNNPNVLQYSRPRFQLENCPRQWKMRWKEMQDLISEWGRCFVTKIAGLSPSEATTISCSCICDRESDVHSVRESIPLALMQSNKMLRYLIPCHATHAQGYLCRSSLPNTYFVLRNSCGAKINQTKPISYREAAF